MKELFKKHADEQCRFYLIPDGDRLHVRPDLCAMLYLHERFGGVGDAVEWAEQSKLWLDFPCEGLTEEDVIYILRCGVCYDGDTDCLFRYC